MKTLVKHIVANTYKPLLVKYLSSTRVYRYQQLKLQVPAGVFHPAFFFSTKYLLNAISALSLKGKRLLELGAGSGLIALMAAKQGAIVTASDINPVAIEYLQINSRDNQLPIQVIRSDLFDQIPVQSFDFIAINPPYYSKQPGNWAEYAWYCGKEGEYFFTLFSQLPGYIHPGSVVLMVLCEGCDLNMIQTAASLHRFRLSLLQSKNYMLERNFIYSIESMS